MTGPKSWPDSASQPHDRDVIRNMLNSRSTCLVLSGESSASVLLQAYIHASVFLPFPRFDLPFSVPALIPFFELELFLFSLPDLTLRECFQPSYRRTVHHTRRTGLILTGKTAPAGDSSARNGGPMPRRCSQLPLLPTSRFSFTSTTGAPTKGDGARTDE